MRGLKTKFVGAVLGAVAMSMPAWAEESLDFKEILAGDWRTEDERARDEFRNPQETLAFFGLKPGDTVVEVWPGRSGWYTKVLAPYVKANGGTFIAANFNPSSEFGGPAVAAFKESFVEKPEIYGDVQLTVFPAPEDSDGIAPAGSADLVVTFRNVHNWVPGGYAEKGFADMFAALKPGGTLGVIDHRLPADLAQDPKLPSGYIHEAYVKKLAEDAGFVFEASSDINNNPKDTADHPFGVWTLPPNLRGEPRGADDDPNFDHAPYVAIGESDRFTLRFRKPAE